MNANTIAIVVLLAAGALFIFNPTSGTISPSTPPAAVASGPVADLLKGHPKEAARLAAMYDALADVLSRDATIVTTTAQLREAHKRIGSLVFQGTGFQGTVPGLAAALDAPFVSALGLDTQPLTPALRELAVGVARNLAAQARSAM